MRQNWTLALLLAAVIHLLSIGASAQPPAAEKPASEESADAAEPARPTRLPIVASGALRVMCAAESGLDSPILIQSLILNKESVESALKACNMVIAPGEFPPRFEIDESNQRSEPAGVRDFYITVNVYDAQKDTTALMRAMEQVLNNRLANLDPVFRTNELRHKQLITRAYKLGAEIQVLQRRYDARAKQLGAIPAADKNTAAQVLAGGLAAEVVGKGLEARREALERRIAEVSEQVAKASNQDEELVGLMRIVKARHEKLALTRKLLATDSGEERERARQVVLDAEAALAQAQADVARYQNSVVDSIAGRRLAQLQQRLDETLVELAEQSVKTRVLGEQLSVFNNRYPDLDQMRLDIELREQQYAEILNEMHKLEIQNLLHQRPEVLWIPGIVSSSD